MYESKMFIGMDVHKDSVVVAVLPGANRPFSRISLSTRFLPTRIAFGLSRALTFLWPSPRKSLSWSTCRISWTNSSSVRAVFGPRFFGSAASQRSPRA